MDESIHELVSRWRDNPSPTMTVALCDALRGSSSELVQQVGQFAAQRHAADVNVLVSVARMYLDSSRYADAQTVLVAAGKQAPRDAGIYRWLGETLLRRGDADRAEKVLQRAIQLGANGADIRVWLERARVFRPMQAKAGTRAVAAEVAHTAQPARELLDSMSENTTDVHLPRPKEFTRSATPTTPAAVSARPPPEEPRQYSKSAQTYPTSFDPPAFDPPAQSLFGDAPSSPSGSGSGEIEISVSGVAPLPTSPAATPERKASALHRGSNGAAVGPSKIASPQAAPRQAAPRQVAPRQVAPQEPGTGALVPHTRDVLDALTFAGLFEPTAPTGPAAWDRPGAGPKRRGKGALIGGMVAFIAASVGTYLFYQNKRAEAHVQAEAILVTVEAQLEAGKPDTLGAMEHALSQALELESRSPRAALDWTRERAIVGLLKSGGDVAFEDAMARAKDLGVTEDKYAFAQVASFLFQNDTAGAAAVLPRWDGPAATDAWYQLVAGAALERAGDSRAKDRYAAAAKVDPAMVVAQVGLARVTAIEGDSQKAMTLAKELRLKFPDRAEPVAL
ncbi:MAG TPA: tetratricopeptide repeat protein, partial [Polyangiaceae bacterium]|nr:tetratricopeptide repeat protein [Polyangiaceae bacterium]